MPQKSLPVVVAIVLGLCGSAFADQWQTIKNCQLIPNPSNDGDSFHVRTDGKEFLFRLYFVDTPESETDRDVAARVAEQAKHFGLTEQQSIQGGIKAKEFTKRILSQPFTVITKWQKALGRSKLQRYYAVVMANGGKDDLAELLVKAGMARAHGLKVHDAPRGRNLAFYDSLERQAKAQRMGLYGGNTPHTSENSESRLGSSFPSRLPVKSEPVAPAADGA